MAGAACWRFAPRAASPRFSSYRALAPGQASRDDFPEVVRYGYYRSLALVGIGLAPKLSLQPAPGALRGQV